MCNACVGEGELVGFKHLMKKTSTGQYVAEITWDEKGNQINGPMKPITEEEREKFLGSFGDEEEKVSGVDPEKILSPLRFKVGVDRGGTSVVLEDISGRELPTIILALHAMFDAMGTAEESPTNPHSDAVAGLAVWIPDVDEEMGGPFGKGKKNKKRIGFTV